MRAETPQGTAHEVAAEAVAQGAPARRQYPANQRERGVAGAAVARRSVGAAVGHALRRVRARRQRRARRLAAARLVIVCHGVKYSPAIAAHDSNL
jgi:hypothetical protein